MVSTPAKIDTDRLSYLRVEGRDTSVCVCVCVWVFDIVNRKTGVVVEMVVRHMQCETLLRFLFVGEDVLCHVSHPSTLWGPIPDSYKGSLKLCFLGQHLHYIFNRIKNLAHDGIYFLMNILTSLRGYTEAGV